jgi:hypothetical protein
MIFWPGMHCYSWSPAYFPTAPLRSRSVRRMHRLEKIADGIFILAMIGMVIICALITYNISIPPEQPPVKAAL